MNEKPREFVEKYRLIINKIGPNVNNLPTLDEISVKILCAWGRQACDIIDKLTTDTKGDY